jgi:hypothetical protein
VPEPGNPQDLNRYSYVRNSPLRYSDPTGHYIFDENYRDPTSSTYSYFLGPKDAEAIFGVDTPQRVVKSYLIDPYNEALPYLAGYVIDMFAVAGAPMPHSKTPFHVPDSLRSDVIGDPGFGPEPGFHSDTGPEAYVSPRRQAEWARIFEEYIEIQVGEVWGTTRRRTDLPWETRVEMFREDHVRLYRGDWKGEMPYPSFYEVQPGAPQDLAEAFYTFLDVQWRMFLFGE